MSIISDLFAGFGSLNKKSPIVDIKGIWMGYKAFDSNGVVISMPRLSIEEPRIELAFCGEFESNNPDFPGGKLKLLLSRSPAGLNSLLIALNLKVSEWGVCRLVDLPPERFLLMLTISLDQFYNISTRSISESEQSSIVQKYTVEMEAAIDPKPGTKNEWMVPVGDIVRSLFALKSGA